MDMQLNGYRNAPMFNPAIRMENMEYMKYKNNRPGVQHNIGKSIDDLDSNYYLNYIYGDNHKYSANELKILLHYKYNIDEILNILERGDITDDFELESNILIYACSEFCLSGNINIFERLLYILQKHKIKDKKSLLKYFIFSAICGNTIKKRDADYNKIIIEILEFLSEGIGLPSECVDILISNESESLIYSLLNNYFHPEHLDLLFKRKFFQSAYLIIQKHNIIPSYSNLIAYIKNSEPNSVDLFNKLFDNMKFTIDHLNDACHYAPDFIESILKKKIIPNEESYLKLITSKCFNQKYIDLLVQYGYQLSDQDIIDATKCHIKLNDSKFTKKFIPTKEFYNACTQSFMPKYNDKMYEDTLWVDRILELMHLPENDIQPSNMKMLALVFELSDYQKSYMRSKLSKQTEVPNNFFGHQKMGRMCDLLNNHI
jgi:hypothetical protein